jgi:transposase
MSTSAKEQPMLTVPGSARLFLYKDPISMHKSFEGLSVVIEQMFPGELLSGAYFIFLNRKRDHMKVLFWDGDGFGIFYKRLEKGVFSRKQSQLREYLFLHLL